MVVDTTVLSRSLFFPICDYTIWKKISIRAWVETQAFFVRNGLKWKVLLTIHPFTLQALSKYPIFTWAEVIGIINALELLLLMSFLLSCTAQLRVRWGSEEPNRFPTHSVDNGSAFLLPISPFYCFFIYFVCNWN